MKRRDHLYIFMSSDLDSELGENLEMHGNSITLTWEEEKVELHCQLYRNEKLCHVLAGVRKPPRFLPVPIAVGYMITERFYSQEEIAFLLGTNSESTIHYQPPIEEVVVPFSFAALDTLVHKENGSFRRFSAPLIDKIATSLCHMHGTLRVGNCNQFTL